MQQSTGQQTPPKGPDADSDAGGMRDDVETEDIDDGSPIDEGTSIDGTRPQPKDGLT